MQTFSPDLAGFMFSNLSSKRSNEACRIAFLLHQPVQAAPLRHAFDDLRPRFPSFFVGLQRKMFSNQLVNAGHSGEVLPPQRECLPFKLGAKHPLVRAIYDGNWLAFEFAHIVADGGAGMVFAKTLLARYLELCGHTVDWTDLAKLNEPPTEEELRDDYKQNYRKCASKTPQPPMPFHYYARKGKRFLRVTTIQLQLPQLLAAVKAAECTVTEYLVAAYMLAFYRNSLRAQISYRPIRITIPVSLRKYYNSTSLRNFSLVTDLCFYPRKNPNATHEDILDEIRGKLATLTTPENIDRMIYTNQSMREMPLANVVPNAVLRLGVRVGYMLVGEGTSSLSNLGTFTLPPSLATHVQDTQVAVSNSRRAALQTIAHTYQNHHNIIFTRSTRDKSVILAMAKVLQELGLDAQVLEHR